MFTQAGFNTRRRRLLRGFAKRGAGGKAVSVSLIRFASGEYAYESSTQICWPEQVTLVYWRAAVPDRMINGGWLDPFPQSRLPQ